MDVVLTLSATIGALVFHHVHDFAMAMRRNQYSNPSVVQQQPVPAPLDLSVVLVTAGYDHEIRFWEAWSGICSRTIPRTGEAGVCAFIPHSHSFTHDNILRGSK